MSLFLDSRVNANGDDFGYLGKASLLADRLIATPSPVVCSICAPWGAGKSTFVRFLFDEIEKRETKKDLSRIKIYFNAWDLGAGDAVLTRLVSKIADQLKKSVSKKAWETLKGPLIVATKAVAGINPGVPGVSFLADILDGAVNEENRILAGKLKEDPYQIRAAFKDVCKTLVDQGKEPWVIVDDLDRCNPGEVVRVIEALRMILGADEDHEGFFESSDSKFKNPFRFIVPIDEDFVEHAFASAYSLSKDDATKYLRKFINMRYEIGPLSWNKYLSTLTRDYSDFLGFLSAKHSETIEILDLFNIVSIRDGRKAFGQLVAQVDRLTSVNSWNRRFSSQPEHRDANLLLILVCVFLNELHKPLFKGQDVYTAICKHDFLERKPSGSAGEAVAVLVRDIFSLPSTPSEPYSSFEGEALQLYKLLKKIQSKLGQNFGKDPSSNEIVAKFCLDFLKDNRP